MGNKADLRWSDGKRYAWLLGLFIPALPLLAWWGHAHTGWSLFWWSGPIVFYGLIPLLEPLLGEDRSNPPADAVAQLEADRYYRWCTYAYLPLMFAGLIVGAWLSVHGGLEVIDMVGLALTVGVATGVGINAAHELGHKLPQHERWLSKLALAPTGYGHFFIEHNRGHHVRVATPEDPASSRLGESLYAFIPRTVIGSFRSSVELERKRLTREGRSFWTPHNHLLQAWSMSVVLFGGLIAWLGWGAIPFLLVQGVYGFLLLEIVNYLEHYGLVRQKNADGRYERCAPCHSWNSNHTVTNLLLYHLQRHSDHHANPTRRYQSLRHFDEAPQLPAGYATMITLALFPPLWRRVMDPRVLRHYAGDVRRANLQPSQRASLLKRYGAAAA